MGLLVRERKVRYLWGAVFLYVGVVLLLRNLLIEQETQFTWNVPEGTTSAPVGTVYDPPEMTSAPPKKKEEVTQELSYLIDTPACKIRDLDLWDEEVRRTIPANTTKPKCSETRYEVLGGRWQQGPPLVSSTMDSLQIELSALPHYGLKTFSEVACCFRPLFRLQEHPYQYTINADNHEFYSEECIPFNSGWRHEMDTDTPGEDLIRPSLARVECYLNLTGAPDPTTKPPRLNWHPSSDDVMENLEDDKGWRGLEDFDTPTWHYGQEVYRDFHAFVPLMEKVEERCQKIPPDQDSVSVLVLGVDTMSRLAALRDMPRLHRLLTEPPFEAVQLLGYSSVGENTFPNVLPLMTGLVENELVNNYNWMTPDYPIDHCPFLWREFAEHGFRTALLEDDEAINTFNFGKTGFVEQPTDYYLRPLFRRAEAELAHEWTENVALCLGPRLAMSTITDFLLKLGSRFPTERHFAFAWTSSLTHDEPGLARHGDEEYVRLFSKMAATGLLNRTVLVVLSDHGVRFGPFRMTDQGKAETSLPMAYISLPAWFRERFPEAALNLRLNAHRLTTAFDVHATLRDLLKPASNLEVSVLKKRTRCLHSWGKWREEGSDALTMSAECLAAGAPRGISLFLPVPALRTCDHANVPSHLCSCQPSERVNLDNETEVAPFVVNHINSLLLAEPHCAQLSLVRVMEVRRLVLPLVSKKVPWPNAPSKAPWLKWQMTLTIPPKTLVARLQTSPGDAVFEATIVVHNASSLEVTGPISRLNLYGDQSRCVRDYHLKLFCFCT